MDKLLFIDLETYSGVDLKKSNVYKYTESPDFEILMCAWATADRQVKIAVGEKEVAAIPGLLDPAVTKVAHNAQFERVCLSRLAGMPTGVYLSASSFKDTQALAGVWGYPQSLDKLAKALGAEEKDTAGTRLINLFSKPQPRTHKRIFGKDRPQQWQQFIDYCIQDVYTLIDCHDRLATKYANWGGFPTESEYRLFLADQRINDRGIATDLEMAVAAVQAAEANREEQLQEMRDITGVDNPGSVVQLGEWLEAVGTPLPDLKKETISAALETADGEAHRVLQLRQEVALVASKKYTAAISNTSEDGRLRGSFKYFGAHTGRWSGRGVQLQNLPSATLPSESASDAAITDLLMGMGATAETLKALVRQLFVGPFTVCDYSAIEARVVAWLAGEQWALDAFADGRDIYIETAGRMFNLDYDAARDYRKQGKVAVLALGYNGGVNSLRAMGAEGTDNELQHLVTQWRQANRKISGLWQEVEDAFRSGTGAAIGSAGLLRVEKDGRDRYLMLPSGRAIVYHDCGARWETNKWGNRVKVISFADPKAPNARVSTYGGRLVENATQAVARDILAEGILNLSRHGYKVVGHVHDEVLVEGASSTSIEQVSKLLTENPRWATGLPLAAEGYHCRRYRKA